MVLPSIENPKGQMPNPIGINEMFFGGIGPTSYTGKLYPGVYRIWLASGGGNSKWHSGYWFNAATSGGSGGAWEGDVQIDRIIDFRADVLANAANGGDCAFYFDGVSMVHISGGTQSPGNADTPGGTITVNPDLAKYTTDLGQQVRVASNGNVGKNYSATWGSPTCPPNPSPSTGNIGAPSGKTWGWGAGSNDAAVQGGFAIQRIA